MFFFHWVSRPIIYGLLFIILTACTSTIPKRVDVKSSKSIDYWYLLGNVAIFTPDEKNSAMLVWDKQPEETSMELISPLGTTLMALKQQKQNATLTFDGKEFTSNNIDTLIYEHTGWRIPFHKMETWMKGYPTKGDRIASKDADGNIKKIQSVHNNQLWQIEYHSWHTLSGAKMPFRMTIKHHDIKIKLRIDDWIPRI